MEFKEALAALEKLEGGAALAAVFSSHVNKLDEKIYTTIGESRTKGAKASSLEATVLAIAKSLGIEGDVDTVLTGLEPKVTAIASDLKAAQTKLTETETRATTAETKVQGFERKGKFADIASQSRCISSRARNAVWRQARPARDRWRDGQVWRQAAA
jgi:hypothetical protein